jgi:hypothetical protein
VHLSFRSVPFRFVAGEWVGPSRPWPKPIRCRDEINIVANCGSRIIRGERLPYRRLDTDKQVQEELMSKCDNDFDIPVHWLDASMIPAPRLHVYLPNADAVSACRMSHVARASGEERQGYSPRRASTADRPESQGTWEKGGRHPTLINNPMGTLGRWERW